MDLLLDIIQNINAYLSDYILTILLIGTGLWFTVSTGFVQIRCFGEGLRKAFKKGSSAEGISPFQALTTAVAAQVGTGNLVGACGAILTGGPGAIFWMWVIAFFGMATVYAEAVLAVKTREAHSDGTFSGGPVYYIKTAFKGKPGSFLAGFFAIAVVIALGFTGAMVQSNSISSAIGEAFEIDAIYIGLAVALCAGLIFMGGVKRIASVTEKLVPVMALFYLAGGLMVLILRASYIPETFGMIFKYAFHPEAIVGGSMGYALKLAISQGVKRGLFSNEAGMGSTPHAHAIANVKKPHDQGVVAMVGVFIDTFVVLTTTALVVISTLYAGDGPLSPNALPLAGAGIDKTNMVQRVFAMFMGENAGSMFVALCLLFFAFSTILSWNYFGKINASYLMGKKITPVYTLAALGFIVLGAVLSADIVWELSDMFNQLMVIPNVLALWALSKIVIKSSKDK